MTKYARLTNQRLSTNKRSSAPIISLWQKIVAKRLAINALLTGVMLSFGVVYIGIMNSGAADTLQHHALTQHIEEIRQSNHDLTLSIAEAQSLQRINEVSKTMDFVNTTDFHYLNKDSSVALSE